MKDLLKIGLFLFATYVVQACQDVKSYPPEPEIEFKSLRIFDTIDNATLQNKVKAIAVLFSFVDGDGDLFSSNDTIKSLFLTFYKKVNGSFQQIPDSILKIFPPYFQFPYSSVMDRQGQNKTQKGTIKFNYFFYYPLPADTIKLDFYIQDLALHKSNLIEVPKEIVFK